MKRRNWTPQQKLEIVLEGLKENCTLAELCNRYQITQTQYYQWKDRLLGDGHKVFARGGVDKESERLEKRESPAQSIIGDLTVELKKTTFEEGLQNDRSK